MLGEVDKDYLPEKMMSMQTVKDGILSVPQSVERNLAAREMAYAKDLRQDIPQYLKGTKDNNVTVCIGE